MDKSYPIKFTEQSVIQLEMFADFLENLSYSKEDLEVKILTLFLNIESLLPYSNIFDYVYKTDINKEVKLNYEIERKEKFERINELVAQMDLLYVDIDNINNNLSKIENEIDESEWRVEVNSHEEMLFNKIKEKLIINKKLNYGAI